MSDLPGDKYDVPITFTQDDVFVDRSRYLCSSEELSRRYINRFSSDDEEMVSKYDSLMLSVCKVLTYSFLTAGFLSVCYFLFKVIV